MANSRWPDLPPEIAGDILSRLPSPDDRLSFAAACRDWRLLAAHQRLPPPPAMPWIHLGRQSTYQRLDDGVKARRFGTPAKVRASFGGCLLCETKKHRRCFLRDPFSPATPGIEVPCRATAAAATSSSVPTATRFHLVTSSDKQKLLMVRWSIPARSTCRPRYDGLRRTMWLQVFEAGFG
ncbi:hypothetical protein BRADI_1g29467v3 [Brachypodium distachyon]|uniref:F-box domain-containing protein n=1 Tax=Brachypodium distachyon TaxID=15368 RepID=A0A0Q3RUD2_BRADI|nr:hypothetical protein BRADI_1g29467v3 [Brachypodium distachyon]